MDLARAMHEWSLAMGQPAFVVGGFVKEAVFSLAMTKDRL